jgi:hypothetical protein
MSGAASHPAVRGPAKKGSEPVRRLLIGGLVLALLLVGFSLGRAADRDETAVTVQVSAAEHESQEGYFSLGPEATVIARPGSELHRFLTRQNGRKVRMSITVIGGEQLSRLER